MDKAAAPRKIQPSGLSGLRHATTKATTAPGAVTHTCDVAVAAFRLSCASRASGTAAAAKTSTKPPSTTAATGKPKTGRSPAPCDGTAARPNTPSRPPADVTLRPERSGN